MTQSKKTDTDTHANEQPNSTADFDKASPSLNPEQLAESFFQALQKLWLHGRRTVNYIMYELGGNEFLESTVSWCAQHPDIALCLLAGCFVFFLPLLIIFGFGIITMAITFTGILVLEGTLLTVVFMVFLACIGSLAVGLFVFAVVAYFGLAQISSFLGIERHRDTFIRILQEKGNTRGGNSPRQNVN